MKKQTKDKSSDKTSSHQPETKGVKTLLGDPKKAIIMLAWPMIVAMAAHTIYNLVDAIWVSGLGADALSAVGFFFPFFFMAMAIATGLGVGGGAAISRRIGAKDKTGADNVAVHTLVIMIILAVVFTIPFFFLTDIIFNNIGASDVLPMVSAYAKILFAGTIVIFFTNVANAILRAEGDATRAMYAMMLGAGLNIVLDPIFIYTFGLGVAGAAWATLLSLSITAIIMFFWLFIKKDTYVSFSFKKFKWDRPILKDISSVGLPASIMQLSMAFTMLIMNIIVVSVGGTDGVAVFSTGWRVVTIAILPLIGIATAVTSVTGAAFGAKDLKKLNTAYFYSIKVGLSIAVVVAILTYIFAPQITAVFTQAEKAAHIADDLIIFLQIVCLFYPGVAFGMFSSAMFQGTGKGMNALFVTIFRTVILAPPFAILFITIFDLGLPGIWLGLVIANLTGSLVAFTWARIYINSLKAKLNKN